MSRFLITLLFIFVAPASFGFSYDLEMTEAEIQEKVSALMPIERKKLFFTVVVSDPKVDLIASTNEIAVFANLAAMAPGGLNLTGRTKLQGTLSYDAKEGAFYFHNPKVMTIEIDQLPEQFAPKVKELTQSAMSKATEKRPIYRLKDDDLKQKLAKSVLKSIVVKDEKLVATLSAF